MTSKDDFVKAFQEWDGSGVGLLTEKSAMAALKEMNLPFTAQELTQHVAVGKQVSGDANGKIKLNDFATYMSFEVVKKGAAQPAQPQQQQQQQPKQQQQQQDDNPFAVFGFDTNGNSANNNNNNNGNYNNNNQKQGMVGVIQKKPGIKVNVNNNNNGNQQKGYQVAVTPVQGKDEQKQAPVDMRDAKSPTRANDNELPDWFGHSLTSPVHGQGAMPQQDAWDMFGFDSPNSTTKSQSNSQQPQGNNANNYISSGLKTPATPNIHYSPETPANQKRAQTPNSGLIAPPRQGNRSKSPKSKTRPSSPDKNEAADPFSQFSFGQANASMESEAAQKSNSNNNNNNNANDYQSPSGSASPNDSSKKEKKKKRKAKKSYEKEANDDEVEEAPKKEKKKEEKKKPKKHKTDAIAQMKRGTAMLKYGRHGFPHFRRFQLSRDNQRLLWYSRKKSLAETHIQIKDIKDVLEGQQTEVFKQCTQRTLKKASFSIIYGAKLKTLDVVAKSQEEAQLWTKGLKGLMKANKVGKLHKVVQILVDVPYVDITKPKGKEPTRDPNSKQQFSAELIQTIEHTLRESKKTFEVILKLSDSKHVLKSPEYENVSTLVSELEQRLNEVETGLNQKNVDFIELKRDVWVLKVDVTVLEEKLRVLAKPNSAMFL